MRTRVTITLDPEVHQLARKAAKRKRTTVSGLIESLIQSDEASRKEKVVDRMVGSAAAREPEPGTDPLYDALRAKYVRR